MCLIEWTQTVDREAQQVIIRSFGAKKNRVMLEKETEGCLAVKQVCRAK